MVLHPFALSLFPYHTTLQHNTVLIYMEYLRYQSTGKSKGLQARESSSWCQVACSMNSSCPVTYVDRSAAASTNTYWNADTKLSQVMVLAWYWCCHCKWIGTACHQGTRPPMPPSQTLILQSIQIGAQSNAHIRGNGSIA